MLHQQYENAKILAPSFLIGSFAAMVTGLYAPDPLLKLAAGCGSAGLLYFAKEQQEMVERWATEIKPAVVHQQNLAEVRRIMGQTGYALPEMAPMTAMPTLATLANLQQLIKRNVSFLIFGNSGAGKTSIALHLVGELTAEQPHQVLVFDPHLNDWADLPVVHDMQAIIRGISLICIELEYRKADWARQCATFRPEERKKNWDPFIVLWDEVASAIGYAKSEAGKKWMKQANLLDIDLSKFYPEWFCDLAQKHGWQNGLLHPAESLLKLGSELRKFNGVLIGMTQSGNVEALGIDSNYRANYIDIHVGESALKQSYFWDKEDPRRQFVEQNRAGYPCVIIGEPAAHPTHADYPLYQNGNVPRNVRAARLCKLALPIASDPIVFSGNNWAIVPSSESPHPSSEVPEVPPSSRSSRSSQTLTPDQELLERLFYKDSSDPSSQSSEVPGTAQNSRNDDDLFRELRELRNLGISKTNICKGWEMRHEDALKEYDRIAWLFAEQWCQDLIAEGLSDDDIILMVWAPPENRWRKHRQSPKYTEQKALLARLRDGSDPV